jgi:hypothetical protein
VILYLGNVDFAVASLAEKDHYVRVVVEPLAASYLRRIGGRARNTSGVS